MSLMHSKLPISSISSRVDDSNPSGLEFIQGAAVIAAFITGVFNLYLAYRRNRDEERARKRELFAQAYATYTEYKEYPYVIRRRNYEKPAEERIRISEQIRKTQERLSFFVAWTRVESAPVGIAYAALVSQARRSAGTAMKSAWEEPAVTKDSEMSISRSLVDLPNHEAHQAEYFEAVENHLKRFGRPWSK